MVPRPLGMDFHVQPSNEGVKATASDKCRARIAPARLLALPSAPALTLTLTLILTRRTGRST